jgi:hypothetical protein
MERHETCLGSRADQHKNEDERGKRRRRVTVADRAEGVGAVRPCQQAEGEQQGKRAHARHDEIDTPRAQILAHMVVRHDERP